jgi:hypothetical protein
VESELMEKFKKVSCARQDVPHCLTSLARLSLPTWHG